MAHCPGSARDISEGGVDLGSFWTEYTLVIAPGCKLIVFPAPAPSPFAPPLTVLFPEPTTVVLPEPVTEALPPEAAGTVAAWVAMGVANALIAAAAPISGTTTDVMTVTRTLTLEAMHFPLHRWRARHPRDDPRLKSRAREPSQLSSIEVATYRIRYGATTATKVPTLAPLACQLNA